MMGAAGEPLWLSKPLCLPQILADISCWIIFAGTPGEFTEDIAVQRSKFFHNKSVRDTGLKPKPKCSTHGCSCSRWPCLASSAGRPQGREVMSMATSTGGAGKPPPRSQRKSTSSFQLEAPALSIPSSPVGYLVPTLATCLHVKKKKVLLILSANLNTPCAAPFRPLPPPSWEASTPHSVLL